MANQTLSKEQLAQLKTLHSKCKEWIALAKENEASLPAAYKAKLAKRLKQITAIGKVSAKAYEVHKPEGEEMQKESFLEKVVDTVVPEDVQETTKELTEAMLEKARKQLFSFFSRIKEKV